MLVITARAKARTGYRRSSRLEGAGRVRRPPRSRYVWVKEGEEIDWERLRKLLCPSLRLQGLSETLGGRADVFLDRSEQEDE